MNSTNCPILANISVEKICQFTKLIKPFVMIKHILMYLGTIKSNYQELMSGFSPFFNREGMGKLFKDHAVKLFIPECTQSLYIHNDKW